MGLTVLIGGARSGKSRLAIELVKEPGDAVTFIATAEPGDEEMRARIAAHRLARPSPWKTIEEPLHLSAAMLAVSEGSALVIDCLTLWVANLIAGGDDDAAIASSAESAARLASERATLCVVVTNEVGSGLVPMDPLGRRYRDLLGEVNALFAAVAQRTLFVVAGQAVLLHRPSELLS